MRRSTSRRRRHLHALRLRSPRPHGGIFVLAIPNAVSNLGWSAVAIVAGTIVTTIALLIAKRPLQEEKPSGVTPSL